jgi:hypothetical protein
LVGDRGEITRITSKKYKVTPFKQKYFNIQIPNRGTSSKKWERAIAESPNRKLAKANQYSLTISRATRRRQKERRLKK